MLVKSVLVTIVRNVHATWHPGDTVERSAFFYQSVQTYLTARMAYDIIFIDDRKYQNYRLLRRIAFMAYVSVTS